MQLVQCAVPEIIAPRLQEVAKKQHLAQRQGATGAAPVIALEGYAKAVTVRAVILPDGHEATIGERADNRLTPIVSDIAADIKFRSCFDSFISEELALFPFWVQIGLL